MKMNVKFNNGTESTINTADFHTPIPDADCENCEYKQLPHDGLHCYMFETKVGDKCGQFKPVIT